MFPYLTSKTQMWFDGWYRNTMCTKPVKEYFITDNTDFYGLWEKNEKTNMVTLKVCGAVVRWLVGEFRTVVDLPKDIPSELHKDNCTLLG